MKSCEIEFVDIETQKPVFRIQLYGVSRSEMLVVPPPISIPALYKRHGIDPLRYATSPFHVYDARRYRK